MDADRIVDAFVGAGSARPSADVETFIKAWEFCALAPYKDSGGRWTCGYGHLMEDSDPHDVLITQEEADAIFHCDLQYTADGVARLIYMPLHQYQFDALCALSFNIGLGALAGSTLRKRVNGGYFAEAADQFLLWNKVRQPDGSYIESRGLTKRRTAERAIFVRGDYSGRP